MEFYVKDILSRVYGVRGLPFPAKPNTVTGYPISQNFTGSFNEFNAAGVRGKDFSTSLNISNYQKGAKGTPLWKKNALGAWVFCPVKLDGEELPNPLITIAGSKEIVTTDVIDVGTVFEKVFTKPYDITIICTLINEDDSWPEAEIQRMQELYVKDKIVTLECALTDIFLTATNNFLVKSISLMDMQGIENSQVVQIDGYSNIDFELTIED